MPIHIDQMGRRVELPEFPKRIVSLVPSQTELLYDLGCGEQVVGQTVFCVHPKEKFKSAKKIGGTKKLKLDEIIALNPDLIIGNKEENSQDDIQELEKLFPVWMSDIYNLADALRMIKMLGGVCGKSENAKKLNQEIAYHFKQLHFTTTNSCLYLIWRKPWMAAGTKTFINDMLDRCGLQNVCRENTRYPEFSNEDIVESNPKFVLLSSEPYPFAKKHITELQQLLPNAKIMLVDGELFSWYGSRLRFSASYFQKLFQNSYQ